MNTRKKDIKDIILRIIAEQSDQPVRSFNHLKRRVTEALHPQDEPAKASAALAATVFGRDSDEPQLSEDDRVLFSEIYWDLVIKRVITPDLDSLNRQFERFRIHSEYSRPREGSA